MTMEIRYATAGIISGVDHFGKISVATDKSATTATISEDISERITLDSDDAILNENSF